VYPYTMDLVAAGDECVAGPIREKSSDDEAERFGGGDPGGRYERGNGGGAGVRFVLEERP